ncbi:MAG: co-chaperone protein DjlA [Lysobacteraceae bacterium]|nr:MAG: co-chaperone protein DjlA [Xanthomonadaceae bacterium]
MSWWGKVLGGTFGFLLGGPIGALLGAALGHSIDSGVEGLSYNPLGGGAEKTQMAFFTALFAVLGHLAKSDGRVSVAEIRVAESLMDQMRLSKEQRRVAVRLFTEGKRANFPLEEVLEQFASVAGRQRNLQQMFLEILIDSALIDGPVTADERRVLARTCVVLGFEPGQLEQMIRMRTQGRRRGPASPKQPAFDPYAVLGVEAKATDAEVKRAYRRLMSQHHPDKLVSKGLPEEMMDIAKQRVREIRQAYDLIKQQRGTLR